MLPRLCCRHAAKAGVALSIAASTAAIAAQACCQLPSMPCCLTRWPDQRPHSHPPHFGKAHAGGSQLGWYKLDMRPPRAPTLPPGPKQPPTWPVAPRVPGSAATVTTRCCKTTATLGPRARLWGWRASRALTHVAQNQPVPSHDLDATLFGFSLKAAEPSGPARLLPPA